MILLPREPFGKSRELAMCGECLAGKNQSRVLAARCRAQCWLGTWEKMEGPGGGRKWGCGRRYGIGGIGFGVGAGSGWGGGSGHYGSDMP